MCMMTTLALLIIASGPTYQGSGIPTSQSAGAKSIEVQIHSVKFALSGDGADVTSMTLFRNQSDKAVTIRIDLPRAAVADGAAVPAMGMGFAGTWDKRAVQWMKSLGSDTTDSGSSFQAEFGPHATHALRLKYRIGAGTTGYEDKKRMFAYSIDGANSWAGPIGKFDVAFTYTQHEVFGLPELEPKGSWQVGQTGAFARFEQFQSADPKSEIRMTYYPGGFASLR